MNAQLQQTDLDQIGARQILDALADGAYITDVNRKILFWSQAAERITGWLSGDVVGHSCADNILVHVDKDGHSLCGQEHCPLHRSIVTGQPSSEPLLIFAQHKQGYRIPVQVSVAPLREPAGKTVGGIEIFRDLTGMMEDLRRAKVIQDHSLECEVPRDDRVRFEVVYSPEDLVGGDFYRLERVNSDCYAVMVADVMGHGVASALYTMQLRSLWEECRGDLDSPARFLGELNRRLYRLASPDGYFATAVLVLFDAASGRLRYVRAGHPSPFLFRAGGMAERFPHTSPAIGLIQDASYKEMETHMAEGDCLLLFTDGALEIVDAEGALLEESGFLRLLEGLGGNRFHLGHIERRLLEFSNAIRLPDDLTLMSIYRRGPADRG
jgi:sigma-B regulation protein RsbU (phosphoserine phosphatase)